VHERTALSEILLLELHSHVWTGMSVSEAVNRNLGIAHPVQIRDEFGEAIDPEVSSASPRRPMNSISDSRDSSQPFSSRDKMP
jgi:hypothetical protein